VIFYGVVSANGATAVKNPRTQQTVPLVNGRYFVMLSHPGPGPNGTSCVGCDNLRAINARGKVLEADYGPAQYRNHQTLLGKVRRAGCGPTDAILSGSFA
jgi:hypothetical protein